MLDAYYITCSKRDVDDHCFVDVISATVFAKPCFVLPLKDDSTAERAFNSCCIGQHMLLVPSKLLCFRYRSSSLMSMPCQLAMTGIRPSGMTWAHSVCYKTSPRSRYCLPILAGVHFTLTMHTIVI